MGTIFATSCLMHLLIWSFRTGVCSRGKEFPRGANSSLRVVSSWRGGGEIYSGRITSLVGALVHFGTCLAYIDAADGCPCLSLSGSLVYVCRSV